MVFVSMIFIITASCSSGLTSNPAGKYIADNGSYIIITDTKTWHGEINEKSSSTGIEWNYSYGGTINERNELVITKGETRRVISGGAIVDGGNILGELVGNEIHSGGLVLKKQNNSQTNNYSSNHKQYKKNGIKSVSYVQITNDKVFISTTYSKYDVRCIKFKKKGIIIKDLNGVDNGILLHGLWGVRVLGVKNVSGYYRAGDYTYETGPWPDEDVENISTTN